MKLLSDMFKIMAGAALTPGKYKVLADEHYEESASVLQTWADSLEMMVLGFNILDYKDEKSGKTLFELIEEGAPKEHIADILQQDECRSFANKQYGYEDLLEPDQLAETLMQLASKGRASELIRAAFLNEGLEEITLGKKTAIRRDDDEAGIYSSHKKDFERGLQCIGSCRFPKGEAKTIATFLSHNKTFRSLLKGFVIRKHEDSDDMTLQHLVGGLINNAPNNEERAAVITAFLENHHFAGVIEEGIQSSVDTDLEVSSLD